MKSKYRHIRPAKRHIYRYAKQQNKTKETIAKIIRILTILFYIVISSLSFCFVRYTVLFIKENEIIDINPSWNALTGKTKIMEFKDPDSRKSNRVRFVISNPPEKEDSLLNLVSEHFWSYAPNDTIKKYEEYVHKYYKETWNTRYDYKTPKGTDFGYDYISKRRKDLLITIEVSTALNKQKIELYKKGYVDRTIERKWRDPTPPTGTATLTLLACTLLCTPSLAQQKGTFTDVRDGKTYKTLVFVYC